MAHIGVTPSEAPAGGTAKLSFAVGHGCDGSPTTNIRIRIPDSVAVARPQPKAGWQLDVTRAGPVEAPKNPEGQPVTARISEVSWKGSLPDDFYDEFVIQVRMPDQPGTELAFPIVQECEKGANRWIQVAKPGEAEPEEPAPVVHIGKKTGHSH
jgi:uncharacterized protein YcnI